MEKCRSGVDGGVEGASQVISRRFDWRETPPSVAAARLLGVALNCDPTTLDPLGETVDAAALDRLLTATDEGLQLQFTHQGFSVLLSGDGTATVEPASH